MNMKTRKYRAISLMLVGLIIALLLIEAGRLYAAAPIYPQQSLTPTPTPVLFPGYFSCPPTESIGLGPTWNEIQIGVTSWDDMKAYLESTYDDLVFREDSWEQVTAIIEHEKAIYICVDQDTSVVTAIDVPKTSTELISDPRYMYEYIARFGEPDAVSYTTTSAYRALYWFEHGITLTVDAWTGEGWYGGYGLITQITYFPYSESAGFEDRYPFNRATVHTGVLHLRRSYTPPIPTELDPFDWDEIMATITPIPTQISPEGE